MKKHYSLGHLPFVGESYKGVENNQEYCKRFLKVETTIDYIQGFSRTL